MILTPSACTLFVIYISFLKHMIRIDFSFLFLLRLKFFLNGSYLLLYLLDRRKMHLYLLDLNIIVCCSAHRSGYSLKSRLYLRLVQKN